MEVTTQVSYNGYRAGYKITSFNSAFFHAILTEFSGTDTETPPVEFIFIRDNERTIASSDVIGVAKELLKEINFNSSADFYSIQKDR